MTSTRRELGAVGEDRVAAWYEANGYSVVDRNWRCRQGELDLVARRGRTVVFCEVKTRSSTAFGAPVEAVTRTKQARLRVLAARWLEDSPLAAREIRFDVASVLDGRIEVLQGAF
ncbi:MAG TPA: YraN family protein [Acidimicrobiales bacterium]|nr:YraN family protein [Acidimicrobiales bacterium]